MYKWLKIEFNFYVLDMLIVIKVVCVYNYCIKYNKCYSYVMDILFVFGGSVELF